jgi:oxaloacetate decarboxylase gamma subunit
MAISGLLMEGVNLMLLGMGMVFTFLAVLVVALNVMSRLASSVDWGETPAPACKVSETDDSELIAVISTAINKYRNRN